MALGEVERFVHIQKDLLSALRLQVSSTRPLSEVLSELPRRGGVSVQEEVGEYVCHGSGVRFREKQTAVVVDVHVDVDRPDVFDVWRLRSYFGSLGRRGVRVLERAVGIKGVVLERALAILLDRWMESGDVVATSGGYRLPAKVDPLRGEA
jgi:hypothetical protein